MSTNFRPKARIQFPNTWALNSFLLKLKRFSGWEYIASSDQTHVKVKPKGANEYILIGLNKAGGHGAIEVDINAEKLGDRTDHFWIELYDYARRYRC
ncbi:MAG: hypothetical protein JWP91_2271 [Fibrobacteres bacterium]|nr:hypothetical protein [Fibrobacterota bacterium]